MPRTPHDYWVFGFSVIILYGHTFATVLLEQRENPKIVMKLMGHTKIKTTLDPYSHVVDDKVYEQTAQTLDGVYNAMTQKKNPPNSAIVQRAHTIH